MIDVNSHSDGIIITNDDTDGHCDGDHGVADDHATIGDIANTIAEYTAARS